MLWFNFILGLNFFLLFLGMVMYDNEFETKEYKIRTKDKIEPQHIYVYINIRFLALNRIHKPFLALPDDRSSYSYFFLNRQSHYGS